MFQGLSRGIGGITFPIRKFPRRADGSRRQLSGGFRRKRTGGWRGSVSICSGGRGGSAPEQAHRAAKRAKSCRTFAGAAAVFLSQNSEVPALPSRRCSAPVQIAGLLTRTFGVSPTSSQQSSQFPNDRLSPIGCLDSVYTVPGGVRFPIPFLPLPFCFQSPVAAATCSIWLWIYYSTTTDGCKGLF